jgi:hypothetical protein
MASLTRRAWLASAVLLAPAARLRLFAQPSSTPALVSLDEFIELSQRLLGRSKLDRDLAQVYLSALLGDAETAVHLATLAQSNGNPTPEQSTVARTIIEWWYTGVYTTKGAPYVATYTGALMWPALGITAPGTCVGPFGAWSRPPDPIA